MTLREMSNRSTPPHSSGVKEALTLSTVADLLSLLPWQHCHTICFIEFIIVLRPSSKAAVFHSAHEAGQTTKGPSKSAAKLRDRERS